MPAIKYYEVTETRRVKVSANNAADAARIASIAFEHGQNSDNGYKTDNIKGADLAALQNVWGNTTTAIETVDLNVSKEF